MWVVVTQKWLQKSGHKKWLQKSNCKKVVTKEKNWSYIKLHAHAPAHSNKFTSLTDQVEKFI